MRRGCARFATSRRSSHLASGRPHATPSALATMTMEGAAGAEGDQGPSAPSTTQRVVEVA
jgi:hypothetical protein